MPDQLYIKYYPADTGARPIPNCGQQAPWPWLSTSIRLVSQSGSQLSDAKVGQGCFIEVSVDSKGAVFPDQPPNVQVQVWVCDYTLGVGPAGAPSGGSIGPAGLTELVVGTVPPTGLARILWTPVAGDFLNVNPQTGEAHMCIGANCYFPGTAPGGGDGAALTNMTDQINVCNNQHHAQLNIAIAPATPEPHKFLLPIHHFEKGAGPARYIIEVVEVGGALAPKERHLLAAQQFVGVAGGKDVDLAPIRRAWKAISAYPKRAHAYVPTIEEALLAGGGKLVLQRTGDPIFASRRKLTALGLAAKGQTGTKLTVDVPKPRKGSRPLMAELNVGFPAGEKAGAYKRLDVLQRRPNGRVVGAARLLLVAPKPM